MGKRLAGGQQGFTLIEATMGACGLAIALLSFLWLHQAFFTRMAADETATAATGAAEAVIVHFQTAPIYQASAVCDALGAWSQPRSSACAVLTASAAKGASGVGQTPLVSLPDAPINSQLLGQNLFLFENHREFTDQRLFCMDLIQCRRVISNSLFEFDFDLFYETPGLDQLVRRRVIVRRGSRI